MSKDIPMADFLEWCKERNYALVAREDFPYLFKDIVRCGECEYWTGYCTNKIWQSPTDDYLPQTYADDFCSYGERRTDEHTD